MTPLLNLGTKKHIGKPDLIALDSKYDSEHWANRFETTMQTMQADIDAFAVEHPERAAAKAAAQRAQRLKIAAFPVTDAPGGHAAENKKNKKNTKKQKKKGEKGDSEDKDDDETVALTAAATMAAAAANAAANADEAPPTQPELTMTQVLRAMFTKPLFIAGLWKLLNDILGEFADYIVLTPETAHTLQLRHYTYIPLHTAAF
jgi:hypothetical protein